MIINSSGDLNDVKNLEKLESSNIILINQKYASKLIMGFSEHEFNFAKIIINLDLDVKYGCPFTQRLKFFRRGDCAVQLQNLLESQNIERDSIYLKS